MRFHTLPEWLDWQEKLHFTDVDPGLERIGQVWQHLAYDSTLPFTIVTVAGTNGKGSSVAMLSSILREAGYNVGTYTSPHILRYNERICIAGQPCEDAQICAAFELIDQARGDISLTYFEFATLAAMIIFHQQKVDIVILEVGMGGRLDAVNLFDADIALITPISLDHTHWLGSDRELIGREKAGVMRAGKPTVCSETPPDSLIETAQLLGSSLFIADRDFDFKMFSHEWQWSDGTQTIGSIAFPALEGQYQIQNASAVIQVISLLRQRGYSISNLSINKGLKGVQLAGRFQRIAGDIELILDVTHNQQGAINLAKLLTQTPHQGRTFAVLGMLKDKDPTSVTALLKGIIDRWFFASLTGSRGMAASELAKQCHPNCEQQDVMECDTVENAFEHAMKTAVKGDRVLVFGSFHTVEAVLRLVQQK